MTEAITSTVRQPLVSRAKATMRRYRESGGIPVSASSRQRDRRASNAPKARRGT